MVKPGKCSAAYLILLFPYMAFYAAQAKAACTTGGAQTVCDATAPNPSHTTIGDGIKNNRTVTVEQDAALRTGDAPAISLRNGAHVTLQPNAVVSARAVSNPGNYGYGANTIEFRSQSTLDVARGARVLALGPQTTGNAIGVQGQGNVIHNDGLIEARHASAIALQNSNGTNTIVNGTHGVIQSPGNAIEATDNGAVHFTNRGQVIGNVMLAAGNDVLHLHTGSSITGDVDGNLGTNIAYLKGSGTGVLDGALINFDTLSKTGSGTWNLPGALTNIGNAQVHDGTLVLTGDSPNFNGRVQIGSKGTVEARAESLPQDIHDNGLLNFVQTDDATYSGFISGRGVVWKTGPSVLTLAPCNCIGNTYTGGTMITAGTLRIGADNAIGAASGPLTFNGGTLQISQSFDLAPTRDITINAPGGTFDTQSYNSTIAQNISGPGAFTKAGTGVLTLNGDNGYAGGTSVAAGTLAIGDALHPGGALSGGGLVTIGANGTLGGYGSVTGNVQNNGTLAVADALPAFAAMGGGAFAINGNVSNAGTIAVGGAGVGNRLVINGNYVGQNGSIALNTYLGSDNSPSDKVVLNGGTATGTTSLLIKNVGGPGAQTQGDGIQVVQLQNGATSNADAFKLGAPVKAGAYAYNLVQGGSTSGGQSWYLSNTLPGGSSSGGSSGGSSGSSSGGSSGGSSGTTSGTSSGTGTSGSASVGGLGAVGGGGGSANVSSGIPLYRVEAPVYDAIPMVARGLGLAQIDTFHDRQGEQSLLNETGSVPAAWGRVWGGRTVQSSSGPLSPEFDGTSFGAQVGQDIYADRTASGHSNHYGFFLGFSRATGDVEGFANGTANASAGHLSMNAYSVGGYWTHIGPGGWYTDSVLMASQLTINPLSSDGIGASTHGHALLGSIEGGMPIPLTSTLTIEPQAQLVWQNVSFASFNDGISNVSLQPGSSYVARIGARLKAQLHGAAIDWTPYLRVGVLHSFGHGDVLTLGDTTLPSSLAQTTGQLGAGLVAKLNAHSAAFATVNYYSNLGGSHQRSVTGDAGIRWTW